MLAGMLLAVLAAGWGMHSHNDYLRARPFYESWEAGAVSIEADVFLRDGELMVAHDAKDLKPERSLRSLYLEPLSRELPKSARSLILLVDIKQDGAKVLPVLLSQLKPLHRWMTAVTDGRMTRRPLTVVVSGDRPVPAIAALNPRYVFVDGRLVDDQPEPADPNLAPLVSDSWLGMFKWNRAEGMPLPDRARLAEIVYRVHQNGQKLRFWATPDDLAFYPVLANAGVDLIGTDYPSRLAKFRDGK